MFLHVSVDIIALLRCSLSTAGTFKSFQPEIIGEISVGYFILDIENVQIVVLV